MDNVTFVGPAIDDAETYERAPRELRALLVRNNGYIAFDGGLHVRGACRAPAWHSLREAWTSPRALHRLFHALTPEDVPFAEDALGDQFILREGVVKKLIAETGRLSSLDCGLAEFLAATRARPMEYLGLYPLAQFREEGGTLAPGELLSADPPFSARNGTLPVTLRAMPAAERIHDLARLAARYAEEEEERKRAATEERAE